MTKGDRPDIRDALTNWRESDLPFHEKARLAAKNEWIKLRTRHRCCGHIDEPGC